MTRIDIKVAGAAARLVKQEGILTDGMVGATATFVFDGAWDGLSKMAVFRAGGVTRDQIMGSDTVRIPPEVLLEGKTLYVGVEGRNGDGSLVIPTVWVRAGTVYDGANASGDPSTDPTLPVWAQIVVMIGELDGLKTVDKSSLVEAINEVLSKSGGGSVDEDTIAQLVEEYLAENPPKVTETDPTVPDWAKQSTKPSYTAGEVGAIPVPEMATVGQTIVVEEVDEDGKPVKWECADVVGGALAWRKLRWLAVPSDPSTDTSGITWITDDEGGVIGFEFDTDADGNGFECSELSITTSGTCADSGAISFYAQDSLLCKRSGYQNTGSRSGWGELQKRNGIWRWIGAWGTTLRFIHDTGSISTTGFSGSSSGSSVDAITTLRVQGDVAFNAGYYFDIWGR